MVRFVVWSNRILTLKRWWSHVKDTPDIRSHILNISTGRKGMDTGIGEKPPFGEASSLPSNSHLCSAWGSTTLWLLCTDSPAPEGSYPIALFKLHSWFLWMSLGTRFSVSHHTGDELFCASSRKTNMLPSWDKTFFFHIFHLASLHLLTAVLGATSNWTGNPLKSQDFFPTQPGLPVFSVLHVSDWFLSKCRTLHFPSIDQTRGPASRW